MFVIGLVSIIHLLLFRIIECLSSMLCWLHNVKNNPINIEKNPQVHKKCNVERILTLTTNEHLPNSIVSQNFNVCTKFVQGNRTRGFVLINIMLWIRLLST